MAARGLFVTGTDTGVGKTEITLGLMRVLQRRGHRVLGMKPVASGAERIGSALRNPDAWHLRQQGSIPVPYGRVNPYVFAPAIAPHLAAAEAGVVIEFERIQRNYAWLAERADWVLVEGVGGWRVPLGSEGDLADLACRLNLPVILVVGLRLGCINHALLTRDAIRVSGCQLAGWVGNLLDPTMARLEQNLATLGDELQAPCLGVVGHLAPLDSEAVALALAAGVNDHLARLRLGPEI